MKKLGRPDTTIIDLHRADEEALTVGPVEGEVQVVQGNQGIPEPAIPGQRLTYEHTVVVAPGAQVVVAGLLLRGGRRGKAHGFVRGTAFRPSPGREDVPQLIAHLEQIEEQLRPLGEDPLQDEPGPVTPYEKASSAEYARLNLQLPIARTLDESLARMVRSVLLFVSEDTAFVAFARLSVPKLRTLMAELGRPIQPHLVEELVIDELLLRVYGR